MTWLDSGSQRSRSQQAIEVRTCEHNMLWTTWTFLMNLTVNNYYPVLMTRLDSGGQRSRSQQAVEVAQASTPTLGRRSLCSSYMWCLKLYVQLPLIESSCCLSRRKGVWPSKILCHLAGTLADGDQDQGCSWRLAVRMEMVIVEVVRFEAVSFGLWHC